MPKLWRRGRKGVELRLGMHVNCQHPTALQDLSPSIFLRSVMPKQGKEVWEQRGCNDYRK